MFAPTSSVDHHAWFADEMLKPGTVAKMGFSPRDEFVKPGDLGRSRMVGGHALLPMTLVQNHSTSVSVTTYVPGGR